MWTLPVFQHLIAMIAVATIHSALNAITIMLRTPTAPHILF
jgi:hypothetical protein